MQALAATIITTIKNFYVDDGLFSFSSETELIFFFKQIVTLLASLGFPLTKFFTTCDEFKKTIPKNGLLLVKTLKFKDENCMQNTLGMTWCSQEDCFKFNCSFSDKLPEKLIGVHVLFNDALICMNCAACKPVR